MELTLVLGCKNYYDKYSCRLTDADLLGFVA
jgi:hypothetical protein